jgi:hypothetical protein
MSFAKQTQALCSGRSCHYKGKPVQHAAKFGHAGREAAEQVSSAPASIGNVKMPGCRRYVAAAWVLLIRQQRPIPTSA